MVSCVICYEKLGDSSPCDPKTDNQSTNTCHVSATDCGHLFHTFCIVKWMSSGRSIISCPVCKHKISTKKLTTIYQDWTSDVAQSSKTTSESQDEASKFDRASRLHNSFVDLNARLYKTQEELALCNSQLNGEKLRNHELMAKCQEFSERLTESTALQKDLESELATTKKERERLTRHLRDSETKRSKDTQMLNRLQINLNLLKGLESITTLSLDSEFNYNESASGHFLKTDPEGQFKLFKALELKATRALRDRNKYIKLYENSAKKFNEMQVKLESSSHQILQLQKLTQGKEGFKLNARPAPENFSFPTKEPRVIIKNPFVKEVKSRPSETETPETATASPGRIKKRARSPVDTQSENSINSHFDSLSLDPVIDLTNETSPFVPRTSSTFSLNSKHTRRNPHLFHL